MTSLPTGTVTFLFTDIEGSTKLAREHPKTWEDRRGRHHTLLRAAIEASNGYAFQLIGDAFCAAFHTATDAVHAAAKAQIDLQAEDWGDTPIRVRMGIHTGRAELQADGQYVGYTALSSVQRLMSAGHGGQVLLSPATEQLVRDELPEGVELRDLGEWQLKDLLRPTRIFQIVIPGLAAGFAPLRAAPAATARSDSATSLLDRIVRGRLIGRERELAEASLCWQRTVSGEAQVLLISGEPGVGKTRLGRELMDQVKSSGARVLTAQCYAEGGAPYGAVAQIVEAALAEAPALQDALPPYVRSSLLAIAPNLALKRDSVPPALWTGGEIDQEAIFDSVAELCARLTVRTPLLLLVDDAHWADPGTLYLLRHLARRSRSALQKSRLQLMIVLTYREAELDEARALNEVLLDLNRERLATRIKLSRLSKDRTGDMLSAMFAEEATPDFLEGIFRETEGNPFFVEEVCKGLVEAGSLTYADGRWHRPGMNEIEIPQNVRLAIQSRVGRLPLPAQEALTLAAVIGREFDFETLLRASGQDEELLIESLEAAARAQLVEETNSKGAEHYSFMHALIATTLYEGLSGRRRHRAHERVAATLEALHPDDLEALAHHFAMAEQAGKAVEYARRAAARAQAIYAHEAAIAHLRLALDFVGPEQVELRRDLLEQLADVLSFIRDGVRAVPLYQEALSLWQVSNDGSRQASTRLLRKIIEAADSINREADLRGFQHVLEETMQAGLRLVEDQPPDRDTVRLLTSVSIAVTMIQDPPDWDLAERYARRAVEMAEKLDSPVEICYALNPLKYILGVRGLFRERLQTELRRLALSQDPRFDDPRERIQILNQAGDALASLGEYVQAMPHLLEAERLAAQVQDLDQQVVSLRMQSYCLYQLDRWDQVIQIDEKWRALEKRYPSLFKLVWARCFQMALNAGVRARRGEHELAAALRADSYAVMLDESGSQDSFGRGNYF